MAKVKYTGRATRRRISKEAFKSHEINQDTVVWNGSGDVQEVSASAAKFLSKQPQFEVEGAEEKQSSPSNSQESEKA